MSELSDQFGHYVHLTEVRAVLHHELDAALDDLLDRLPKLPANDPERIVIEVAPALLRHVRHAQELLP